MIVGQTEVAFHDSRVRLQPHINVEGLRLSVSAGDFDVVNPEVAIDNILTVDDVLPVGLAAQVLQQILLLGRQILGDLECHTGSSFSSENQVMQVQS